MRDNNTTGNWFPNFMKDIIQKEAEKNPKILNQISNDQDAEDIIDEVLIHMPRDRNPKSPAKLLRILDVMGKSHLYNNVYNILTQKYNMRFKKLRRKRNVGRRRGRQ